MDLTHIIAFSLKCIEQKSDAILNGCHKLPDTVLVGGILCGPSRGGKGTIQLGDEATTGSCWGETRLTLMSEL